MRSAFVTGGSGFIGGHLVERLAGEGWRVRALARSERSAAVVRDRGAEPVHGDLDDGVSLRAGAEGCDVAFHAAATLGERGDWDAYVRGNVEGTRRVLDACRAAGVGRFVHVGTEAALLDGRPLVWADESAPLRSRSPAPYSATKARAEILVRQASRPGFRTVVVRPRLVWGPGDSTILPGLVDAVRSGRFAWIGGGRHLTMTTHVRNTVEGLVLAADRGAAGAAYFVCDDGAVQFRSFVTDLLATAGVAPPARSIPLGLARVLAGAGERAWGVLPLPGEPPISRLALWLSALECTLDTGRARDELGYEPVVSREDGLAELRSQAPPVPAVA